MTLKDIAKEAGVSISTGADLLTLHEELNLSNT